MTKICTIQIPFDVKEILLAGRVDGNCYHLPDIQLDRSLYLKVNKILTALGGKWNRKAGGHLFDEIPDIFEAADKGEIIDEKKTYQFFETPPDLAKLLIFTAGIDFEDDCKVLEPSAGKGAIARFIPLPSRVVCIEIRENLCEGLADCGFKKVVCADFLKLTPDDLGHFDRIVMNPPFTENQDIRHIRHAYKFLNPGGRIISICSEHPFFANDKESVDFRTWITETDGYSTEDDDGAFKAAGTLVKTRTVCIERRE